MARACGEAEALLEAAGGGVAGQEALRLWAAFSAARAEMLARAREVRAISAHLIFKQP